MSPQEKLDYVEALWARIAARPEDVPTEDWQREVVAKRLAADRAGEGASRPWAEVRQELLSRLRGEPR
ncbi:MAG TPA: addiction module protein [Polyangiaceae bacterium]|nr:addiction module protein [Polyangiaceae bacterium]